MSESAPRPVIMVVDDDPDALARIDAELRRRYASDYAIATLGSDEAAIAGPANSAIAENLRALERVADTYVAYRAATGR